MLNRISILGRLWLAVFRVAGWCLPPASRRALMPMALTDLRRSFRETNKFGTIQEMKLGAGAVADALAHVPSEWMRVLGPTQGRRQGGGDIMVDVFRNIRQAGRSLARRPGFTVVAALTLALGIGANLAIFAVVNAVLIRPLPFEDSERIVSLRHHAPGLDLPELESSEGMVNFYRDTDQDILEVSAALNGGAANLTGIGEADRVLILEAEPTIFDVLRMTPAMGRRMLPQDIQGEEASVFFVTHAAWQTRFGSDPSVIGTTIRLDGVPVEVVGVLPPEFEVLRPGRFGMRPLRVDPEGTFGSFGLNLLARYNADMTFENAERRMQELQPRVSEYFPTLSQEFLDRAGWALTFQPMRERMIRNVSQALWLVMGTVGVVFLIACANVANLFLVRAEERQREIAVHAALGASRRRLAGMVLAESLLLGLLGGAVGVAFAALAVSGLKAAVPDGMPRIGEVVMDGTVAGAAVGLSVLAGLFFGSVAFARVARTSTTGVLRDGGMNATVTKSRQGVRNILVTSQMALALMLLIGAALMFRSMGRVMAVDPGFDPDGVLSMTLSLGETATPSEEAAFFQQVVERLAALPGVTAVGATNALPMGQSGFAGSVEIERFPHADDELPKVTGRKAISPGYFEAMGIELVSGRLPRRFEASDGIPAVWVNERFAETYLPGVQAIVGERIMMDDNPDDSDAWLEIAGVVRNTHEDGLTEAPRPLVMLPLETYTRAIGAFTAAMSVQIRSGLDPAGLANAARETVRALDEDIPVTSIQTMSEIVDKSLSTTTFTLWLLGLAASIALLLGAVGLFGVISYVVSQRTREIGVRVALGAEARTVQAMIVRQALVVTVLGTSLGLLGALGLSRLMASVLYEVSTTDPVAFVAAPAILLCVSLLAAWLPARRASRVDPVIALRSD